MGTINLIPRLHETTVIVSKNRDVKEEAGGRECVRTRNERITSGLGRCEDTTFFESI